MFVVAFPNTCRFLQDQHTGEAIRMDRIAADAYAEAHNATLDPRNTNHDDIAIVIPEGMDLINRQAVQGKVVVLIETSRGPRMLGRGEMWGIDVSVATDDGQEALWMAQQELDPEWAGSLLLEGARIGREPRLASIR